MNLDPIYQNSVHTQLSPKNTTLFLCCIHGNYPSERLEGKEGGGERGKKKERDEGKEKKKEKPAILFPRE